MPSYSFIQRISICGEAGQGIATAGEILMETAARSGLNSTLVKSMPSNIRGGYAKSLVTVADGPIVSPLGDCDILFSLSGDAFIRDTVGLNPGAVILVESACLDEKNGRERFDDLKRRGFDPFAVPVPQIIREASVKHIPESAVALGIMVEVLGLDSESLSRALTGRFGSKGEKYLDSNLTAIGRARKWAILNIDRVNTLPVSLRRKPYSDESRLIIDGNQAVALGAIAAGCSFFASYPITPATSIGEALARHLPSVGGFAYQAEDEMAALGAALGASFAGVKAMTATSGPGLSLMQEFIGYASMAELPVVVVDVQREGPATGMPTKHSQADLLAALFGGHGEGPRIIIAPVSVEDCFFATVEAFNCAEKYQCPVVVLSDGTLGSTRIVVNESVLKPPPIINRDVLMEDLDPSSRWQRYRLSDSGLNPVSVPGVSPLAYCATGLEHNEESMPTSCPEERLGQMEKRFRKLKSIQREFDNPILWDIEGDSNVPFDVGICAWGFTSTICREAVAKLRSEGIRIAAIYPRLLFPFCTEAFNHWADLSSLLIVIEANFTGQFCSIVRMNSKADPYQLTVSRGEPFTPSEIIAGVRSIMDHNDRRPSL